MPVSLATAQFLSTNAACQPHRALRGTRRLEEWGFILSLIPLLDLGTGIAKKRGSQRPQSWWNRGLEDRVCEHQ